MCKIAYTRATTVVLADTAKTGIATRLAKKPGGQKQQKAAQGDERKKEERKSSKHKGTNLSEVLAKRMEEENKAAAEIAAKKKKKAKDAGLDIGAGKTMVAEENGSAGSSGDLATTDTTLLQDRDVDEASVPVTSNAVDNAPEKDQADVSDTMDENSVHMLLETDEHDDDENTETLTEMLNGLGRMDSAVVASNVGNVDSDNWIQNLIMYYGMEIGDDTKQKYINFIATVSR